MGAVFGAAEQAAWRRRFLAGASRSGAAPSDLQPLAALALTAQRDRFERPPSMGAAEFGEAVEDPRPILPEPARVLFRRLLRQKPGAAGQATVRAAFAALRAAGLRPHPFDLPAAEPWMGQLEAWLGPAERAYRSRLAGAKVQVAADLPWEELTPVQRVGAAREQRRSDPAAARALLEHRLPEETAASRANLVQTLSVGLGPDDRDLLTSLLSDRSQQVRSAAQALLARLPGAESYGERLQAAADACQLKKVGIFGGRRKLELTSAARDAEPAKVLELFSGVRLSDLADRLGMKADDLLAETDDERAALALAACGLAEGRTDVLARLARPLRDYGAPFLAALFGEALHDLPPAARAELLGGFIEAAPPEKLYPIAAWGSLVEALEGPLQASTARVLLRSPAAREAAADAQDEPKARLAIDVLTGLAAAAPRACAAELSTLLASLGPAAGPARDFADFLSALPEDAR